MSDVDLIIRMRHVRAATLCSRGARHWFRARGFDWNDFLTNGIPAARVVETGDTLGLRVVEIARKEAADGQQ